MVCSLGASSFPGMSPQQPVDAAFFCGAQVCTIPGWLLDLSMRLWKVLLELQPQVVDSNDGDRGYTALGWLCRSCRRGTVQDKAHHDDAEGQDVES